MLELIAEEDSELMTDDEDSELTADDREDMEAAELDNIELTTDELEDLDPKPDPPPQAVRANKTANKLKRLTLMVITPLWFFGKSIFTTAGLAPRVMQVALHPEGRLIVCVTICLVNRSPANDAPLTEMLCSKYWRHDRALIYEM